MIDIVIPSAGRGSRFNSEFKPKPLIMIDGKTMIENVVDNFRSTNVRFHIISQKQHNMRDLFDDVNVIEIDYYTNGPADTALLAKPYLDPNGELIIVNCDQIIGDWDEDEFLFVAKDYDAVLGCYKSTKPHNSYIKFVGDKILVREKEVISDVATNGLHYWKRASYFFDSYDKMSADNGSVNGEFYIAPTFNYLDGPVGVYMFEKHYPVGTPDDLKLFFDLG